jgi:thiazole synthase
MQRAIKASGAEVVTMGLKRQLAHGAQAGDFFAMIRETRARLLPNTAAAAPRARRSRWRTWPGNSSTPTGSSWRWWATRYTLQPDPFELVQAAQTLVAEGFEVFPYCTDDLVTCQRLLDVGCRILMPWGAPIGSARA